MLRAAFSFPLSDPRDARLLEGRAGGGLMDVGCYCISAARMIAGEPLAVTAQQVSAPSGIDRRLVATLMHEDEVLTHFDCALDLPDRSELEVIGSDGVLRVSDPWHCVATGIELAVGARRREHFDIPQANPYGCELDDFAEAVAGEHPPGSGWPTRSVRRARSTPSCPLRQAAGAHARLITTRARKFVTHRRDSKAPEAQPPRLAAEVVDPARIEGRGEAVAEQVATQAERLGVATPLRRSASTSANNSGVASRTALRECSSQRAVVALQAACGRCQASTTTLSIERASWRDSGAWRSALRLSSETCTYLNVGPASAAPKPG